MKLYNTLTRQAEEFTPIKDGEIRLYACGLTVYSQPHIGNWVAYIYWDVLVRTLRASGYEVEHVQNITDVGHLTSDEDAGEDKMLKGALAEGLTAWQVAEKYIDIADREAYEELGLTRPTHMPRATEYIQQQIDFVKTLEEKGYTYRVADGVYFDTSKLDNYGELARLDIDGLQFGARVADTGKKNPTDFAVWKFSDPSEKRDMEWWAPWQKPGDSSDEVHKIGAARTMDMDAAQETSEQQADAVRGSWGFPGWHLECSVMARELLGDQIDIHTGGIDHIPVHHTNEIAQTEAVTNQKFANFWLHANHIKVDGTKMSKSLGNVYTLQDIKGKGYDLQAFKLLVLSKHYRTEGNFTWEILEAAQNRLNSWRASADSTWQLPASDKQLQLLPHLQTDLDTPKAVAAIDAYLESVQSSNKAPSAEALAAINDLLGIDLRSSDITTEQKQLIKDRETARASQDWAASDKLRNQLKEQGIEVRDTQHGTIWNRL